MIETPTSRWLLYVGLVATALVVNYNSVAVFHGVDFLFGGVLVLIALRIYGIWLGVLAAALASSYTYFLWGHPYAVIIFTAEVLTVGALMRRFRLNMVLSDALYWLVLGMGLVVLFYGVIMATPPQGTAVIALKQAVNGICNALLANLIVTHVPLVRRMAGGHPTRVPMRELLFNAMLTTVLVPLTAFIVIGGRNNVESIEEGIESQLRAMASGIATHLQSWEVNNIAALQTLVDRYQESDYRPSEDLQREVELVDRARPAFDAIYVADGGARTIAFSPPVNSAGERTIGMTFEDRPYYQALRETLKPVVSDVFEGRGGVTGPVVTISVPAVEDGQLRGFAHAALSLSTITTMLQAHVSASGIGLEATLVDGKGAVVTSTFEDRAPMTRFDLEAGGAIEWQSDTRFRWRPTMPGTPIMTRWALSRYGRVVPVELLPGWRLVVEAPFAPHQVFLQQRHTESFAIMFGVALIACFLAAGMATRLGEPLGRLASATTDLPGRLGDERAIAWPRSAIVEVDSLSANAEAMARALKEKFDELERTADALRAAKQDAEEASRAKSQFLANMSHEIRTPLGAILGFTDLMADPSQPLSERQEFAQAIRRNGTRLSRLIDEILDLAKVEAGHLEIRTQPVPLAQVLESGVMTLSSLSRAKGIALEIRGDGPLPQTIRTDPTRLDQILSNIVGNAVKFTERGAVTVTVRLDRDQGRSLLRFEVTDTGPGIEPGQQRLLFQAFVQADSSSTRRFGGTGLGLVLSRRLARLLGGDVHLAASAPGHGSTFAVTIDPGPLDGVTLAASLDEVLVRRSSGGKGDGPWQEHRLDGRRILVVDDAPDNRTLIRRFLSMAGATVETADGGARAIELASNERYDVILMDIQMPGLDGYETLARIRAQGYPRPVIALTAHAMREDRERAFAAGFADHVAKPVDVATLLAKVQEAARRGGVSGTLQGGPGTGLA